MDKLETPAALLALLNTPGTGNRVAREALQAARHLQCTLHALLEMEPRTLIEALPPGNHDALAKALEVCTAERIDAATHLVTRCSRTGIAFVTVDEPDYPSSVLDCLGNRAPALVSLAGNAELFERRKAAVVGARDVSDAGARRARACGRDVARASLTLVSGGAKGVDDAAQRGAIDAGGAVVSILPQGLLTYRGPAYLRDALREHRVLLVSACVPDAPWQTHAAVERNDYIAALAETVCVIEPKKTGGSIRTARAGLEFGRGVFATCADHSDGPCSDLVRAGANPLDAGDAWRQRLTDATPRETTTQVRLPGIE